VSQVPICSNAGAATTPPKWLVRGESTTTITSTCGSWAGKKPTNDAS
jgi:hypothetical protein